MVRTRSRYICTWCGTSSPALVSTKSLNGICAYSGQFSDSRITHICTHKDILPAAIVSAEEQTVLPQVRGDGTICLQVDEVRVACARMTQGADAECEVFVSRDIFRHLAEERGPGLKTMFIWQVDVNAQ